MLTNYMIKNNSYIPYHYADVAGFFNRDIYRVDIIKIFLKNRYLVKNFFIIICKRTKYILMQKKQPFFLMQYG